MSIRPSDRSVAVARARIDGVGSRRRRGGYRNIKVAVLQALFEECPDTRRRIGAAGDAALAGYVVDLLIAAGVEPGLLASNDDGWVSLEALSIRPRDVRNKLEELLQGCETSDVFDPDAVTLKTGRVPPSTTSRKGGPALRKATLAAFAGRCLATGCSNGFMLRSAHVVPDSVPGEGGGRSMANNTIPLRSDLDKLFEAVAPVGRRLLGPRLTIDPKRMVWILDPRISHAEYRQLDGRAVLVPNGAKISTKALGEHYKGYREALEKPRSRWAGFKAEIGAVSGHKCEATGCEDIEVLIGAHILPRSNPFGGPNVTSNGMLLRADVDLLFEARFAAGPRLSIDPSRWVWVLAAPFRGHPYEDLHGRAIGERARRRLSENADFIRWHHVRWRDRWGPN